MPDYKLTYNYTYRVNKSGSTSLSQDFAFFTADSDESAIERAKGVLEVTVEESQSGGPNDLGILKKIPTEFTRLFDIGLFQK